jgi:plasmid stability protein
MRTWTCLIAVLLCAGGLSAPAAAQEHEEIERILRAARQGRAVHDLVRDILAQETATRGPAIREALAAAVKNEVIHFDPSAAPHAQIGMASLVLGIAFSGSGEARVPDPRAFEHLVEIHRNARDVGKRGGTLIVMKHLQERGRVLQYYREVAMLPDEPTAYQAMRLLTRETGPEGLAVARDLYIRDLVSQRGALIELAAAARTHGWQQ